jgi:CRP/FNR family cyclic AMP-dependent transcriptional regulator
MAATPAKKSSSAKKSGIRTFRQGQVIFKENDPAQSLYIIQKGQIRLYRPKGRGFVDLAILRSGEVIGEMAYFDDKSSRRSCSASAVVTTEVIEISFVAFKKTMAGLNPWFKTIINTLADRLRKTNEKVKNLETNSVGSNLGGKVGDYVFFHNIDIIKMLSMLYLNFASTGEAAEGGTQIHVDKLRFYMIDIFNIPEIKFEEFFNLMKDNGYLEMRPDENGKADKIVFTRNYEQYRSIMSFIHAQRQLEDAKQMKISAKTEILLRAMVRQLKEKGAEGNEEVVDLTSIFKEFKDNKILVAEDDLGDAVKAGLCGDIVVGKMNDLTTVVKYQSINKILPCVKITNAVRKINEEKVGKGY